MNILNRKQLPNFGILKDFEVNNLEIIQDLKNNQLLDHDVFNDINVSKKGLYSNFTITNSYCKKSFFTEDESLNGEQYKQLYFTGPNDSIAGLESNEKFTGIKYRTTRLDPDHKSYDPVADELNYGKRRDICSDYINKLLDRFSRHDKVTRVRLAWLKAGFSIKPHIDYDPSYIVRYHIPIITNDKCKLNCIVNNKTHNIHFKADGNVYFLNAGLKHWATNESQYDRIHLIVDVHGQNLLQQLVEIA